MDINEKTIAEIIKRSTGIVDDIVAQKEVPAYTGAIRDTRKSIAEGLAEYFEKDNPLFDRDKFLTACGL